MKGASPLLRTSHIGAALFSISILILFGTIAHGGIDLIPRHIPDKPIESQLWPGLRDDLVIVKFVDTDQIRLREGRLISATSGDMTEANRLTAEDANLTLNRLFSRSEDALERDRLRAQTNSGKEMADLNNYYQVVLSQPSVRSVERLLDELNALPEVEIAYAEPIPELAVIEPLHAGGRLPNTPCFQDYQGYLDSAPDGIDAFAAWTYTGGRGETVKIIDIEIGWNWDHEDMPAPFYHYGSEMYSDHGIAVVGVYGSQDNGYGTTGIANQATLGSGCVMGVPTSEVFDQAVSNLDPGDIYVIELHCPGPNASGYGQDGYIALEWWQANFDVIAMGTANGIICCEAAGNGAEDFDDPSYEGRFDRNVRDSGAIIVGATDGSSLNKAGFSNYGSRVDLAGWGYNVATTGYGDLYGNNQDEWYTAGFSGTSSATPIVTGAVAAMQGIYKAESGGVPLSGNTIAQILKDTGTPTNGPDNIGPRPNLALAVPAMLNDLAEISGVVTDSETRAPIEGALVKILESGTRTTTAADGTYELQINPGSWTVETEKFCYAPCASTVETTAGSTTPHDVAMSILPTHSVIGKVVDEDDLPIADVRVEIADTPLAPAMTAADGTYEITGVPSPFLGRVVATAPGWTPDMRKVLIIGFPASIDLRLADPEDFEADDGGMSSYGDWEWGTPSYANGPDPRSGTRCWGTNLSDNYSAGNDHRLTTPEYDLSELEDPRLTFWHWYSVWGPYDGMNVRISTNGGSSWNAIEPVDGYTDPCIDALPGSPCQPGWAGTSDGWVPVVFDLRDYVDQSVVFRLELAPWGYTNSPGWYIDDFRVHSANPLADVDTEIVARRFVGAPVPSPSTGSVTISYGLEKESMVTAKVFDAAGRLVRRIVDHSVPAGSHSLVWDGLTSNERHAGPGIYFVNVTIGTGSTSTEFTRKFVIVR